MAGKTQSVSNSTIVIKTEEAGNATIHRGTVRELQVGQGMNILVRGMVNPDLSIAESNSFPASDMGENFGMYAPFPMQSACT